LLIRPDGSYTYTPPAGFEGEDSIDITLCDEGGSCDTQTLTIDVTNLTLNPDNAAPIAGDDHFQAVSDPVSPATLSSSVFGNDADPKDDPIEVLNALPEAGVLDGASVAAGTEFTTSSGGLVTLNADGSFDYTPAVGFIGQDSFDYTIVDAGGETDTATVSIDVQPDNSLLR